MFVMHKLSWFAFCHARYFIYESTMSNPTENVKDESKYYDKLHTLVKTNGL